MVSSTKIRSQILEVLKKSDISLSKKMISDKTNISESTIGKYVDVMKAEGILEVQSYGSLDLVRIKDE